VMEFSGALLAQPVQLQVRRFVDNLRSLCRRQNDRRTYDPSAGRPQISRTPQLDLIFDFAANRITSCFEPPPGLPRSRDARGTVRMKMRALISPFILTMLLFGMPIAASAQTSSPLFGTWRVTSFKLQVIGERGEREFFGPNPKGYVILTPEPRIMAFIAADGRKPPTNQAEAAAMLQSMIAYTGRITLESDRFTTDVEVSWNQLYIGKPQVRFYIVEGDKLTLLTPEQESATVPGERITSTLTFERQK
jgi:hypothetical protein